MEAKKNPWIFIRDLRMKSTFPGFLDYYFNGLCLTYRELGVSKTEDSETPM